MESMDEVSRNLADIKDRLESLTKARDRRTKAPNHLTKALADTITVGPQGAG